MYYSLSILGVVPLCLATLAFPIVQRISQSGPVTQGTGGAHSPTSTDWTYYLNDDFAGEDVVVYVVDTGIKSSHPELASRVSPMSSGYTVKDIGPDTEDTDGHGTAVAAVVAGMTVGVATGVQVFPMKVMSKYTWTDLIDDAEHTEQIIDKKSVIQGIGNAVDHFQDLKATRKGGIINITAGNAGKDMCQYRVGDVGQITVGATDIFDNKAKFSNFGQCVDIYVPGKSIVSASLDGKVKPFDGTSFSAPMVTGMIALILSKQGVTPPAKLKAQIIAAAEGKVLDIANYPNSNDRLFELDHTMISLIHL
ncbi:peptidase S8/S53 domain-containing protein [Mycena filopes]|nr:peptidase S8/S53 domain-containing protein [Mycena filopes]